MDAKVVFLQMVMMIIMIGVGYLCIKMKMIGVESKKPLSSLVVNIFNPAVLLSSMMGETDISATYVAITFLAGAGMYAALIAIAHIISAFVSKDKMVRNVRHLMYVFANTGFIGIPVVKAVLGDEYLIYVAIINLEFCLLIYTYGAMQIEPGDGGFSLSKLKSMINIGMITSIAGLVIFMCRIPVHEVIYRPLVYLGNATTPTAMIIVGITMAEQESILEIFRNKSIYLFCVIKMLLIPILSCFILKAVPLPEDIRQVILFMVAVPVGNMPLMMLLEKGLPSKDCSDSIIITTLISAITIPLVVFVYLHI